MTAIDVRTRTNILWSGENPIILLKPSADARETTAVGFFRVDYSPHGSGHAVFVISDLGGQGVPAERVFACYTDNEPVAAWIRGGTIAMLPEFANHDLSDIPIRPGRFSGLGDTRTRWTEIISTPDGEIRLTWSKLGPPFNLVVPVGAVASIEYEIDTCVYPAEAAEVVINGRAAAGRPWPDHIGGQPHSTAFLALSETWYT